MPFLPITRVSRYILSGSIQADRSVRRDRACQTLMDRDVLAGSATVVQLWFPSAPDGAHGCLQRSSALHVGFPGLGHTSWFCKDTRDNKIAC